MKGFYITDYTSYPSFWLFMTHTHTHTHTVSSVIWNGM